MRRDKLPRSTQATTAAGVFGLASFLNLFSSFVVLDSSTPANKFCFARARRLPEHQFWRFMPNDRPARRLRVGLLVLCIAAESIVAVIRYEPDRRTDHIMVAVASDKVETKESRVTVLQYVALPRTICFLKSSMTI